jgi:putative FmdB family regulatory protein
VPIYEYYCPDCHRIYNFLSRSVSPARRPACPRCKRADLERRPSLFAVSRGMQDAGGEGGEDALPPGMDEEKLARAMAGFEGDPGAMDADDPKAAARMMRKIWETAGLKLGPTMDEAFRRMESGEDPESIETDLGETLAAEDPFSGIPGTARGLRKRLPPEVDPELHEL